MRVALAERAIAGDTAGSDAQGDTARQPPVLLCARRSLPEILVGMVAHKAKGSIMLDSSVTRLLRQVGLALAVVIAVTACRPITQMPAAQSTAPEPVPVATIAPALTEVKALPAAGKTVQTDDIVTYYEEYGQGEPVLVLHGATGSTSDFAALIPELSKEFKVYVLDSRGRGRTTDSSKPLSYDLMMSDTLKFMDVIGIDRAHVVGWSDGAIIGLDMAIHHPERIRSLVSYGGQYDLNGGKPELFDWLKTATIDDMKEWADGYRAVSPHPERAELVFEKVRAMLLTQPNMTADQLKTIAVPVLVLDGQDEELINLDQTKEMAQLIPGAELKLMPGVGHFAPYQKPEEFTRNVMEYLRRHTSATAVETSAKTAEKPVLLVLQELSDDMDYMLTNEVGVMTAMLEKAGYKVVTASA
jgi:pimeloyl-ACP methyl ester carboxylesterase